MLIPEVCSHVTKKAATRQEEKGKFFASEVFHSVRYCPNKTDVSMSGQSEVRNLCVRRPFREGQLIPAACRNFAMYVSDGVFLFFFVLGISWSAAYNASGGENEASNVVAKWCRAYGWRGHLLRPGVGETVGANIVRVRCIAEAAVGVECWCAVGRAGD